MTAPALKGPSVRQLLSDFMENGNLVREDHHVTSQIELKAPEKGIHSGKR
jgi:hypothetical protein